VEETSTGSAPTQDAPAPPAAPVTATEQAVITNDVSAYRDARRAERSTGKPAPAPVLPESGKATPDAAATKPTEEARTVSKRQQQINDYERRIAAQDAELARLRSTTAAPAPAPAPRAPASAAPVGESFPEFAAFVAQHPDATFESYMDARLDWREAQRAQLSQREQAARESQQEHQATVAGFASRVAEATTADPAFWDKVSPELTALETREKVLADGRQPGPGNDLATEIIRSELGPQLLRHLTDHPDDLAKLRACTTRGQLIKVFGRLEARLEQGAVPPPQKLVSDVPPPPTTLGSRPGSQADPVRAAVARGDITGYREARRAERLAAHRR
jgi:hypothetical protein